MKQASAMISKILASLSKIRGLTVVGRDSLVQDKNTGITIKFIDKGKGKDIIITDAGSIAKKLPNDISDVLVAIGRRRRIGMPTETSTADNLIHILLDGIVAKKINITPKGEFNMSIPRTAEHGVYGCYQMCATAKELIEVFSWR